MKNVIKLQSYSVDAFKLSNILGHLSSAEKFLLASGGRKRCDDLFFWRAIKFSYLYHSNLRDWSLWIRGVRANKKRGTNVNYVMSTDFFFTRLSSLAYASIWHRIVFISLIWALVVWIKKILTNCTVYVCICLCTSSGKGTRQFVSEKRVFIKLLSH